MANVDGINAENNSNYTLPNFQVKGSNLNGYNNLVKKVDFSKTSKKEFNSGKNIYTPMVFGMSRPNVFSKVKFYDKDENLLFTKTSYYTPTFLGLYDQNTVFDEYNYVGENGNVTIIRDNKADGKMEKMTQFDKESGVVTEWVDEDRNGTFDVRRANDGSGTKYLGRHLLHPSTWFNPKSE